MVIIMLPYLFDDRYLKGSMKVVNKFYRGASPQC